MSGEWLGERANGWDVGRLGPYDSAWVRSRACFVQTRTMDAPEIESTLPCAERSSVVGGGERYRTDGRSHVRARTVSI